MLNIGVDVSGVAIVMWNGLGMRLLNLKLSEHLEMRILPICDGKQDLHNVRYMWKRGWVDTCKAFDLI